MKNLLIAGIALLLFSCGGKTETENKESVPFEELKPNKVLVFKVEGLSDSTIADSISKMIFTFNGIEQMSIQKTDSLVIVNVDTNLTSEKQLSDEIHKRGGVLLE